MRFELLNQETIMYNDIRRVFINRGIAPQEITHYLNVNTEDENNPLELLQMKQGIEVLFKSIQNNENIALIVDCDCDGFTAAALLYNFLWKYFPEWVENHITWYIHEEKDHGLSDKINELIESGVKLVIVPDAGGGDAEHTQILADAGIKTLFIDHHKFTAESYGPGVVINNQHGNYPNRTLSGVGVVFKFCQMIAQLLNNQDETKSAEWYMDLVAIGCTADLMPLTNYETLYYIRNGMNNIHNPLLSEISELQSYSISKHGCMDPYVISFYFAPLINAMIRVGSMEEKEKLFRSLLERYGNDIVPSTKRGHKGETEMLATQVARLCSNARTRQNTIRDKQLARIETLITEQYPNGLPIMLMITIEPEENMDRNILGLIANILQEKYQRPVMLLNHSREEKTYAGSCRNYSYFPTIDLRGYLETLPGVEYAAGHESAFGLCVHEEELNNFFQHIIEDYKDLDVSALYKVDYIFNNNNVNGAIINDIAELKEYYGKDFPEPYVAIEGIQITTENTKLLSKDKHPTIKIVLPSGIEIMKFSSSEDEYNELISNPNVVDLVGKCRQNYWAGEYVPQIEVAEWNIIPAAPQSQAVLWGF